MSNSFDFCIKAATDPDRSNISDRDFSEAMEIPITAASDYFKNNNIYIVKKDNLTVEITYDPDADFQYFTTSASTHDGTLMFVLENMVKCLEKVMYAQTYFIPAGLPKDLSNATLRYTIGNFVVCNEYGKQFATKEKPWMTERTTVLLPIYYSYEEELDETSI